MIFTADAAASVAIAALAISAFSILSSPTPDTSSQLSWVQTSNDISYALSISGQLTCTSLTDQSLTELTPSNLNVHIIVEGVRYRNGSVQRYCKREVGTKPDGDKFAHRHINAGPDGRIYLVTVEASRK